MRELSMGEIKSVAGGLEVSGPVRYVGPMRGASPAGALLTLSFYVGYQIGTAAYNAYTSWRY